MSSCSEYKSCSSCLADRCGWCASSQKCIVDFGDAARGPGKQGFTARRICRREAARSHTASTHPLNEIVEHCNLCERSVSSTEVDEPKTRPHPRRSWRMRLLPPAAVPTAAARTSGGGRVRRGPDTVPNVTTATFEAELRDLQVLSNRSREQRLSWTRLRVSPRRASSSSRRGQNAAGDATLRATQTGRRRAEDAVAERDKRSGRRNACSATQWILSSGARRQRDAGGRAQHHGAYRPARTVLPRRSPADRGRHSPAHRKALPARAHRAVAEARRRCISGVQARCRSR